MNRLVLLAACLIGLAAASPAAAAAPERKSAPAAKTAPVSTAAPPARPRVDSLGADWTTQQDEVRKGVRQGRYIPLSQAIEIVRHRSPGHQLDAGLEQWKGRAVYRIRWAAANGRRIDYIVDAVSGAILAADGG